MIPRMFFDRENCSICYLFLLLLAIKVVHVPGKLFKRCCSIKNNFDISLPGFWVKFYSRTIDPVVSVEFHLLECVGHNSGKCNIS